MEHNSQGKREQQTTQSSEGVGFWRMRLESCVVLHNMLRIHQGSPDRALISDDILALQNEQAVYVPENKNRNPLKGDKHR